jgi:hypothetical protein
MGSWEAATGFERALFDARSSPEKRARQTALMGLIVPTSGLAASLAGSSRKLIATGGTASVFVLPSIPCVPGGLKRIRSYVSTARALRLNERDGESKTSVAGTPNFESK